jgi:hypothetical protein
MRQDRGMAPSDDPAAREQPDTPGTQDARHRRRTRASRNAPRDPPREQPAAPPRAERGLRNLVGAGSSQLGLSGALRGRDVNRPTDEDLAEAEREVVIVRRNWKPPP